MSTSRGRSGVVVDCAGAAMGGALRFLHELDAYLRRRPNGERTIGRDRRVSGPWLAERELRAAGCDHTIALNNVAFAASGSFKTVLLRNALHFLSEEEQAFVTISPRFRLQTILVHRLLDRADRIVVPTASMAGRVKRAKPAVASRVRIMPHPVSLSASIRRREEVILCPVLDAPYKQLGPRLAQLITAIGELRDKRSVRGPELLLTLTPEEAARAKLFLPAWVRLLGRLRPEELFDIQASARAIAYPTTLESFGYPLAEARLGRQPVIAPDTDYAREVAGDALVPYDQASPDSLLGAVSHALNLSLEPLASNPFDPDTYFDALFSAERDQRGIAKV